MYFRKAEVKDKERILEISKTVWDGYDYIPNIIDKWLEDDRGEFTVLEDDNKVIGLGKLTLIEKEVGWLEGLRVAPEARSKGFARKITEYYIKKGCQLDLRALRLSTYFDNHASIHVVESYGFQKVAEFFYCEKLIEPDGNSAEDITLLTTDSGVYSRVFDLILNAPEHKKVNNFMGYGWLFRKISEELIKKEIEKENVYYYQNNGCVQGAMVIYPDYIKDKVFYIPLITGTKESIRVLLAGVSYLAQKGGFKTVAAMVPEVLELKSIYLNSGFKNWEESTGANVFVYQLNLKKGDEKK